MGCNRHVLSHEDCNGCMTQGMWERSSMTEEIRKNAQKHDNNKQDPWTGQNRSLYPPQED